MKFKTVKTLLQNPISKIEKSGLKEDVNKNQLCVCGHWKAKNADKCISCLNEEKLVAQNNF